MVPECSAYQVSWADPGESKMVKRGTCKLYGKHGINRLVYGSSANDLIANQVMVKQDLKWAKDCKPPITIVPLLVI